MYGVKLSPSATERDRPRPRPRRHRLAPRLSHTRGVSSRQCTEGCAKWADVQSDGVKATQAAVNKLFANDTVPADAKSMCLMPGSAPVHGEGRRLLKTGEDAEDSWMWSMANAATENGSVPICFCKGGKGAVQGYCTPPRSIPEQINLQYAAKDVGTQAPPPPQFDLQGRR